MHKDWELNENWWREELVKISWVITSSSAALRRIASSDSSMAMKIAKPAPEMRTTKTPPTFAIVSSSAPPSSAAAFEESRQGTRRENEWEEIQLSEKSGKSCTSENRTEILKFVFYFFFQNRETIVDVSWVNRWNENKNNVFENLLLNCTSATALMLNVECACNDKVKRIKLFSAFISVAY